MTKLSTGTHAQASAKNAQLLRIVSRIEWCEMDQPSLMHQVIAGAQ